jgi:hypothetical protein
MGVRRARRPAGGVAGMKQMSTILLDHGRFARKHVEELFFLFVPVHVGSSCARLQRLDVGAELGQPARVGILQPLRPFIGPPDLPVAGLSE